MMQRVRGASKTTAAGVTGRGAVASRDAETASAFATEWGIPRHHGRYADVLADDEIDAVPSRLD